MQIKYHIISGPSVQIKTANKNKINLSSDNHNDNNVIIVTFRRG